MTTRGYYTLALECDAPQCTQAEDYSAMNEEFTCETRYEALESARKHGWSISHNRRGTVRVAKCWCPFHSEERRANHYRPRKG